MINIVHFIEHIKEEISGDFYPLFFPEHSKDKCVVVNFNEVLGRKGTVSEMVCSFMVRGTHPQKVADKCQELVNVLDRRTDMVLGNVQVILMTAQQSAGQFRGVDEKERYIYQIDFKILSSRNDTLN